MDLRRLRWDVQQAQAHFPNVELVDDGSGGLYARAALQTSVGQVYAITITFKGYPNEVPKVAVLPKVTHTKHMYNSGHICFMLPARWNPGRHDLTFVLGQTAVWLAKHEVYKVKGVWPGPSLSH